MASTAMEANVPEAFFTPRSARGGSLRHGSLRCWERGGLVVSVNGAWTELTPSTSCGSSSPQRSHDIDAIDDVPEFDLPESDGEEWAAGTGSGEQGCSHIDSPFGSVEVEPRGRPIDNTFLEGVEPHGRPIGNTFLEDEAKRPQTDRNSAAGCLSWLFGDPYKPRETPGQMHVRRRHDDKVEYAPGCLSWLFSDPTKPREIPDRAHVRRRHDDKEVEFSDPFKSRELPGRAHVRRRHGDKVEYDLEQCEHVGMLGCGSFGSVSLVGCRITGQSLALKAISKGLIVRRRLERTLTSEKLAMNRCQSPFVVRLAATFNREQHVYFLLEALMGGDLHTVYQRRLLFGSERHTSFYMACVVRALEHLHGKWIIYRDLKLENIVLDSRGYGKLCDFGLSAVLRPGGDGRAFTVCGTPEYIAPEVLLSSRATGYTAAADWWSLGVLVYEMMVGDTPFASEDARSPPHQSVERAVQALPEHCAWTEVVRALCELEPCQRLPMQDGGIAKLQQKEWFCKQHFDWDAHSRQSLEAPYLPSIRSPRDLSNFAAGEQDPPPEVPYVDLGTGWDAEFEDVVGPWLS